jgi:ketose-bisphosphate aldolase
MTFVPVHEMLAACVRQPWAVAAFDTFNLEMTQGIVDAAVAEQSPLLLLMLPGFMPKADWPGVVEMIRAETARASIPIALQLDHCTTLEQAAWGIKLGVSGVMLDASSLPFRENVALTRRTVEMCHLAGVSVEAELGHVGHSGERLSEADSKARLTRVDEAVRFVAETGVDSLAVAVGTIHGLYRGKPDIDFDRLRALREALAIPLVLHGGSDTPDGDMQRAIATGVDKINIWTDVRLAYLRAVQDFLAVGPLETRQFEKMMTVVRYSVCDAAQQKMRVFGSSGKAADVRRLLMRGAPALSDDEVGESLIA